MNSWKEERQFFLYVYEGFTYNIDKKYLYMPLFEKTFFST